jgi:hypothetical protein
MAQSGAQRVRVIAAASDIARTTKAVASLTGSPDRRARDYVPATGQRSAIGCG